MNRALLRNIVICAFVIALCTGFVFNTNNAYARVSLSELLARIEALEAENADQHTRINDLEAKLDSVSVIGDTVRFTGVNVQIVNGHSSNQTASTNNKGNLIVGYNEGTYYTRTGSHNIVVGRYHSYSSYGGLVVGHRNTISGAYASVSGGDGNTASGVCSSVSGGAFNEAQGKYSSVTGGGGYLLNGVTEAGNVASGEASTVSGGADNKAEGIAASVLAGLDNFADGNRASVSGGSSNTASGSYSSVSGGYNNRARGYYASVSGGRDNTAGHETHGDYSSVSGGKWNYAHGLASSIMGGISQEADSDYEYQP